MDKREYRSRLAGLKAAVNSSQRDEGRSKQMRVAVAIGVNVILLLIIVAAVYRQEVNENPEMRMHLQLPHLSLPSWLSKEPRGHQIPESTPQSDPPEFERHATSPPSCTGQSRGEVAACTGTGSMDPDELYAMYESSMIDTLTKNKKKARVPMNHNLFCSTQGAPNQCEVKMATVKSCQSILDTMLDAVPSGKTLKLYMVGDSTVRDVYVLFQMCVKQYRKASSTEGLSSAALDQGMLQAKMDDHLGQMKTQLLVSKGQKGVDLRRVYIEFVHDWSSVLNFYRQMQRIGEQNSKQKYDPSLPAVVYLNYGLHTLWLPEGRMQKMRGHVCKFSQGFIELDERLGEALAPPAVAAWNYTLIWAHSHEMCPTLLKKPGEKDMSLNFKKSAQSLCKNSPCEACKQMGFGKEGVQFLYDTSSTALAGSKVKVIDMYKLTAAAGCQQSTDGVHYTPDVVWLKSFLLAQRIRLSIASNE